MRTGFLAKRSEIPVESVIEIEGGTARATKYDEIVIDIGAEDGAKQGDVLAVLAEGDRVKHPDTGEDLGFVIRIKGSAGSLVLAKGLDCFCTEKIRLPWVAPLGNVLQIAGCHYPCGLSQDFGHIQIR